MREADQVFLVMQYIEGADLYDCIVDGIGKTETIKLMAQICKIVEAVHTKKVLHLDLKPENILVQRSDGRAFLADFGLSERFGCISTGGSRVYAAPEVYSGRPVCASDVWSLGIVFYVMICGAFPAFELDKVQDPLIGFTPGSGSRSIRHLIRSMLRYHPQDRITLEAATKLITKIMTK
jgi:serine/threonine protein kinase